MTLNQVETARQEAQKTIDAAKTIEDRRRMGQFATPFELASAIVRETRPYLHGEGGLTMLEPSVGTGAFVSAAYAELGRSLKEVFACERDAVFHRAAVCLWGGRRCRIVEGDFTALVPESRADVVFANPPYVRHHAIPCADKKRLQSAVARRADVSISGLAGLYCHFLLLSWNWMKPGAVGAWLIPSEWMSVNYGKALRDFLTQRVTLLRVHTFDAADVRFSDALVSSCVVWFRNVMPERAKAVFTYGTDLEHPIRSETYGREVLRKASKWPPRRGGEDGDGLRLGDCFDIRRGIATGDNGFFVLNESTVREKGIPRRYLKPILPSPRHLKVDHVKADTLGVPVNAERRFLLDCTGYEIAELPASVQSYLASGIEDTAKRNLCASRNVWYAQEQREPAPILCSYMGRGSAGGVPVRFILNDSRAIATNSFLMLYPKGALAQFVHGDSERNEAVWNILLGISAQDIRNAGRSYGGGLQKIEPRELARVPCRGLADLLDQGEAAGDPCVN